MARPQDNIPLRSINIKNPKIAGFFYSVKPYCNDIWLQTSNSCCAYAYTDVVTIVHQMMSNNMHLDLSPNPLLCKVRSKGLSPNNAEHIVGESGLEERDGSDIDENISSLYADGSQYAYRTTIDQRFFIRNFHSMTWPYVHVIHELLLNFGEGGNGFPVVGVIMHMGDFSNNQIAAQTTKENPFIWKEKYSFEMFTDRNGNRLPGLIPHAVVITGIFTRVNNPKPYDYSIEIKNSYGIEWGNQGYGWVTIDAFDFFSIPKQI